MDIKKIKELTEQILHLEQHIMNMDGYGCSSVKFFMTPNTGHQDTVTSMFNEELKQEYIRFAKAKILHNKEELKEAVSR